MIELLVKDQKKLLGVVVWELTRANLVLNSDGAHYYKHIFGPDRGFLYLICETLQ